MTSHEDSTTNDESTTAAADAGPEALAEAQAECEQLRDQVLRSHAELDNYRKRVSREREEERRYAVLNVVRDLLPVFDNLQRATNAAAQGGTVDDLRQGVDMVVRQSREILARYKVEPIPAVGQPFDPNIHEAITQMPSAEHPPMTVLQEIETGYRLHDRVLRPAKVIVSSRPAEST
jgi:molecular chaperone GrpE